jgi:hypothetical protein
MSVNHKIQHMVRLETIIHGPQRGKSYLPLSEMPLAGTDPEGPTLIFYAAYNTVFISPSTPSVLLQHTSCRRICPCVYNWASSGRLP